MPLWFTLAILLALEYLNANPIWWGVMGFVLAARWIAWILFKIREQEIEWEDPTQPNTKTQSCGFKERLARAIKEQQELKANNG